MKSKQKVLLLLMCAALLVAGSVFGTLAYLTDRADVTNTFTVGKVGLELHETKTNLDGTAAASAGTTDEGNAYHLLPGRTYIKDPVVTVKENSEDAYVRMLVTVKNVSQLKAALPETGYYYNGDTDGMFLLEKLCSEWNPAVWVMTGYTEKEGSGIYEFRYVGNDASRPGVVKKSESDTVLPALFQKITVPGEIDNDHLALLESVQINVEAHAMQADTFADANEAWGNFK